MLLRTPAWQTGSVLAVLSVGILGTTGPTTLAATPQYQIAVLSQYDTYQTVSAINNAGTVIGTSGPLKYMSEGQWFTDSRVAAVIGSQYWEPLAYRGTGIDINDRGQFIGNLSPLVNGVSGPAHPYFVSGGTALDLTTAGVPADATLAALNNAGTVVGTRTTSSGSTVFTYSNGTVTDVAVPGYALAAANNINDAGVILGNVQSAAGGAQQGFFFDNGTATVLSTPAGFASSQANDINAAGQIVGANVRADGTQSAFVFQNGTYTDLGALSPFSRTTATGINDAGQVVGTGSGGGQTNMPNAFLFSDGAMHSLADLLTNGAEWHPLTAVDIDNKGDILGYGLYYGQYVPFLATPVATTAVPLPAAAWPAAAMLAGLGLLGIVRRRRVAITRTPAAAAAVVTLATAVPAMAATPQYQLTDLSATGMNVVVDVNNHGDIVGYTGDRGIVVPGAGGTGTIGGSVVTAPAAAASATPFDSRGSTIVVHGGQLQRVIIPGAPVAINDAGQIIGVGYFGSTEAPFFFDGSSAHDLTTEYGLNPGATLASLNNAGTIVGTYHNGAGVFTIANGAVTSLGTLGFTSAFASDINDAGTIVGDTASGLSLIGFTRDAQGNVSTLPTPAGFDNTFAMAVNNAGQIAGFNRVGQNQSTARAFVYQNGTYADIGVLPGYTDSAATDINDSGQVIGSLDAAGTNPGTPFLFSDGTLYDINTLLAPGSDWLRMDSVVSLNNAGQFVGYAIRASDGMSVPVLATPITPTPVPLPAAAAPALITMAGLVATGATRRRRRRTARLT
jgi:probable HAF family extracellular repeat protein